MKQEIPLKHQFVEFIPDQLADSTVYVSMRFATVSHLCACGCGKKVVTPLKPTDWTLIFDGKTVSLDPSIGNWSFPCRSHYWIRNNKVRWAENWSQSRIDAGRAYDRRSRDAYFSSEHDAKDPAATSLADANTSTTPKRSAKPAWWKVLWPW